MLKASALYIVIIIALVTGILCAAMVAVAYFYQSEYQKKFRYDQLHRNLESGINILLGATDTSYSRPSRFSLFDRGSDSVILEKRTWGIYDVGICQAFIDKDTVFKAFTLAYTIDSTKWAALYLPDNDRPVSVSGKTRIVGNAFLPKAGIQQAYIDGRAYEGDKRLVIGRKFASDKKLPVLDSAKINSLSQYFTIGGIRWGNRDSLNWPFLKPSKIFNFGNEAQILSHVDLKGNIILNSDTTITISNDTKLENILIFAPVIIVEDGFSGNCQIFATDSISVGRNCHFSYPSCLGIIRPNRPVSVSQARISLGEGCTFGGTIFTWGKQPSDLKPMISLGKNDTLRGQVYSQDALGLKDGCEIDGSLFTGKFIYRNSFTLYENYLINVRINSTKLSPYYLTGGLMPVATRNKKIMQWLEEN